MVLAVVTFAAAYAEIVVAVVQQISLLVLVWVKHLGLVVVVEEVVVVHFEVELVVPLKLS